MRYVGVDLHKQTISLCVMELVGRERKIVERKRFACRDEEAIAAYFPEPAALVTAGLGLTGLMLASRRRKRR